MSFKLALRNIFKSAKQYSLYFVTLIFGVMLFYTFNSLETQSVLLKLNDVGRASFQLVNQVMGIVSIFLAIVLAFLIIYANKYMIRYRSKEFSIYLTLGMPRKKLASMLLVENMMIGFISLIAGLILGVLLSDGLAILTSYMFDIPFNHFRFIFSSGSALKTVGLFIIIYLAMYLFNAMNLKRLSIMTLMKQDRKPERRLRLPLWGYSLIFIFSIALFIIADTMAWNLNPASLSVEQLGVTLIIGMIAVFLFFFSATQLVLFVVKKIPSLYFKKLNPYVFRQMGSEMTTSFVSLSVTCIMIFLAICMLAGGFGVYRAIQQGTKLVTPFDMTVQYFGKEKTADDAIKCDHISLDGVKNSSDLTFRSAKHLYYREFMKKDASDNLKKMYLFSEPIEVQMISEHDYNDYLTMRDEKMVQLQRDEYMAVGNTPQYKKQLDIQHSIHIAGRTLHGTGDYHIQSLYDDSFPNSVLTLVVPNDVAKHFKSMNEVLNLDFKSERAAVAFKKELEQKALEGAWVTRQDIQNDNMAMSMIASYIGMYIGFIFLIASAVVLSIQQLTKSEKEKRQFEILHYIGATHQQCLQALRKQVFIFFACPLLVAMTQAVFAFHFANRLITLLGGILSVQNILMATAIVLLLYIFYFVMTYWNAKRNIQF